MQTRALNHQINELKKIVFEQQDDLNEQRSELETNLENVKSGLNDLKEITTELDVCSQNSHLPIMLGENISELYKVRLLSSIHHKSNSILYTSVATMPEAPAVTERTIKSPYSRKDPITLSSSQSLRS